MNGSCSRVICRQVFPDLVGSESKQRRKHSCQRVRDQVKRGLRRTPRQATWRVGIKPILQDVEISRGKRDGGEVIERVIDGVKLICFISFADRSNYLVKLSQRPAVSFKQL